MGVQVSKMQDGGRPSASWVNRMRGRQGKVRLRVHNWKGSGAIKEVRNDQLCNNKCCTAARYAT